jgi:anti-sigma-K factor RskA
VDKEEFLQLSAEYASGALEGDDLRRLREHLQTATGEELNEFLELVSTASLLPLALERQTPPARVKEELMKRIQLSAIAQESVERRTSDVAQRPSPRRTWLWYGVGAVVVVMIIGVSTLVTNLMGTIERQNTQLVELKDELTRKEELLKVLASRQIEVTVMNGLQTNPVGYGKIIWDPEKRTAILQVSNLPAVPSNKDYQLWVIKGKQPISAGVFAVRDKAPSFFKIENLAVTDPKEIAAFAITLEPKGGVASPTGEMYMAGSPKL